MDEKLKLDSPVRFLKGVGPERSRLLEELEVRTVQDLLCFYPRRYEDRFPVKRLDQVEAGEQKECLAARVRTASVVRTRTGKTFFRAVFADGKLRLYAMWFNAPYLSTSVQAGRRYLLWGRVERSGQSLRMVHPEFEAADAGHSFHFGRIVPVYPLIEDLSQKHVRQLTWSITEEFEARMGERLPEELMSSLDLMPLGEAMRALHFPPSHQALERARSRLVFDEFLTLQLAIALRRRARQAHRPELSHERDRGSVMEWARSLGFELTEGQKRAIDEILSDMQKPYPMNRLLQADVGSGKTLVAAAAVLFAVRNGFQAAFMAPTEVLARQQMFSLCRDLEPAGVRLVYVGAGAERGALDRLASGDADVAVGTHALLENRVGFKNLGLAVVDEQHKFGVRQRERLRDRSGRPAHFLMLTATPIPRSLAMTFYGDLDLSEMTDRPKGRAPVRTFRLEAARRDEAYRFLHEAVRSDGRAFVVCPALSRGAPGTRNAQELARELAARFPQLAVACLHGRLGAAEKERLVRDFRSGKIRILVCTVVIEVGIDVPAANVMVIEDAERFGMAQLHQLRGRVGRGTAPSYCLLLTGSAEEDALERLDVFCRTASGFDIAQKDLESRGQGEVAGRMQHGRFELPLADFVRDEAILRRARREAERLLDQDPSLQKMQHRFLRRALERRYNLSSTGQVVPLS